MLCLRLSAIRPDALRVLDGRSSGQLSRESAAIELGAPPEEANVDEERGRAFGDQGVAHRQLLRRGHRQSLGSA